MSIFMNYEGIQGDVTDGANRGFLHVRSARFGVRRRITARSGTRHDRESANASMSDLYVIRHMDRASPALFIESCCGRGRTVTLRYTSTGDGQGAAVFMEYVLHNALLSNYHVRARAQDNARPVELLRISFTALESRYIPYDENGTPLAPIVQGFDTRTNQRL